MENKGLVSRTLVIFILIAIVVVVVASYLIYWFAPQLFLFGETWLGGSKESVEDGAGQKIPDYAWEESQFELLEKIKNGIKNKDINVLGMITGFQNRFPKLILDSVDRKNLEDFIISEMEEGNIINADNLIKKYKEIFKMYPVLDEKYAAIYEKYLADSVYEIVKNPIIDTLTTFQDRLKRYNALFPEVAKTEIFWAKLINTIQDMSSQHIANFDRSKLLENEEEVRSRIQVELIKMYKSHYGTYPTKELEALFNNGIRFKIGKAEQSTIYQDFISVLDTPDKKGEIVIYSNDYSLTSVAPYVVNRQNGREVTLNPKFTKIKTDSDKEIYVLYLSSISGAYGLMKNFPLYLVMDFKDDVTGFTYSKEFNLKLTRVY